jgi:hypothetical protein
VKRNKGKSLELRRNFISMEQNVKKSEATR